MGGSVYAMLNQARLLCARANELYLESLLALFVAIRIAMPTRVYYAVILYGLLDHQRASRATNRLSVILLGSLLHCIIELVFISSICVNDKRR